MTTTTYHAVTTTIAAAPGLDLGSFMMGIASDADLVEMAPPFISFDPDNGIITITTTGPDAGVDGMVFGVALVAAGIAVETEGLTQAPGSDLIEAFVNGQ